MIIMLLVVLALLAAAITVLLLRIARQQAASIRWLAASLQPKDYSLLDEFAGELAVDSDSPRNIIDQQAAVLVHIHRKLREIDRKLAYVRNFVWEVHDYRSRDDVVRPAQSDRWQRSFPPAEDPKDYGLWTRERDYDAEHDEIVRRAFSRKDEDRQSG